jgi:glycosyltransferase involved in cell wall biosynthesis
VRVVMVSKALVVGAYQRKLEELAQQPDVALTVVVPAAWREGGNLARLERTHTQGYELLVAPLAFNGQFHLHFYPTLGRLLRQLRPDILHMDEEPYNLATWLAVKQGQAVGARCLFFTWQNLQRRYPWPFSGFERSVHAAAAHAIAGNPTAAEVLRAKGYRGPVTVIPQFGVDPSIFSPRQINPHTPTSHQSPSEIETGYPELAEGCDPPQLSATLTGTALAGLCRGKCRQAQDGRKSSFVIGYAGRLVPEKGVDVLLAACAVLPPALDWTLHLLGDGPDQERLVDIARELSISGKVRFLGRVPSAQTPQFYQTLDVLVVPSLSRPNWVEQFGRVLTEAMACGVAVVGSRSGEIPWVIGDAGLIFPEGDAGALAGILVDLAGDPAQCAALAAAGRARVLAQFTQTQIAAETAAVYREMLRFPAKRAGA